jgi:hypothetical protein
MFFGSLNVARMAHGCGADRLVVISTDKAAKPKSVMGAAKRMRPCVGHTDPSSSRGASALISVPAHRRNPLGSFCALPVGSLARNRSRRRATWLGPGQ